jgi:diaminopimelate decarboxylase
LNPDRVLFSGVGKTDDELRAAIALSLFAIQVESIGEIRRIGALAKAMGRKPRIGLRLNPSIEASTHPHLITAASDSKFGIPMSQLSEAIECLQKESVAWVGVGCHLGSQIQDASFFARAAQALTSVAARYSGIEFVDVGGGFAVSYRGENVPSFSEYAKALLPVFSGTPWKLVLELGRSIVAEAGVLLARVVEIKKTPTKNFVIVDAGMNDLIRPPLYDAYHRIEFLETRSTPPVSLDFVGPVCETADWLGKDRKQPLPHIGDWVLIRTAGAYGATMRSRYNSRPLCAEVWLEGKTLSQIAPREIIPEILSVEVRREAIQIE